jgi:hypothetical protein
MNGNLDLETVVLIAIGGGATYIAFLHPAVGTAILVGVAVVTLIILMRKGSG